MWEETDIQRLSLIREPRNKNQEPTSQGGVKKFLNFSKKIPMSVQYLNSQVEGVSVEMTDRDWKIVLSCAYVTTITKDSVIIDERAYFQNNSVHLYQVKSGRAKVMKLDGITPRVIGTLSAGDLFGELSLLNIWGDLTSHSVVADSDKVEVYVNTCNINLISKVMPKDLVEALLQADSKLAIKFYHHVGHICTLLTGRLEPILLRDMSPSFTNSLRKFCAL